MNELNALYKAIVTSLGCIVKPEGEILFKVGEKEIPITINGNQMYLPLSEVLDGNVIGKVFFHPSCEHILSKETEVFKILRKMTVMSLLTRFTEIVPIIINVSKGTQKSNWRKNTLDILNPLKGVTQKQRTEILTLLSKATPVADKEGSDLRFIHFKMTKGGSRTSDSGDRVYYKTVPTFPYYNELVRLMARSEGQPDNTLIELNGNSFSLGSIKLMVHLLQSLIPATLSPDECQTESLKVTAARLISYLYCYIEIADQLNRVVNTFRSEFNKAGIYALDTNWVETIDSIEDIYTQVPVLDFNGHNTKEETTAVTGHIGADYFNEASSQQQQNNQPQYHQQQQQQQQQPQYQQQQQFQQNQNINDGFDRTVPQMEAGHRYVKTEVDAINNRVIHYALNTFNNNPVRYTMTRAGNLLSVVEDQNGLGVAGITMMSGGNVNTNAGNNMGGMGGMALQMLAQSNPDAARQLALMNTLNNPNIDPATRMLLAAGLNNGVTAGGAPATAATAGNLNYAVGGGSEPFTF